MLELALRVPVGMMQWSDLVEDLLRAPLGRRYRFAARHFVKAISEAASVTGNRMPVTVQTYVRDCVPVLLRDAPDDPDRMTAMVDDEGSRAQVVCTVIGLCQRSRLEHAEAWRLYRAASGVGPQVIKVTLDALQRRGGLPNYVLRPDDWLSDEFGYVSDSWRCPTLEARCCDRLLELGVPPYASRPSDEPWPDRLSEDITRRAHGPSWSVQMAQGGIPLPVSHYVASVASHLDRHLGAHGA